MKITIKEARELMVSYHGINSGGRKGKSGVLDVFETIQSIQYDPLNVVGRNSDLVLQARVSDYKAEYLNELLYKDRSLLDGWDKQMCIYNAKDFYNFSILRRERSLDQVRVLNNRGAKESLKFNDELIDLIKINGPMFSNEISLGSTEKTIWGHKTVSSCCLDYLFHAGIVGISEKKNTMKKYDLIENLISIPVPQTELTEDAFLKWFLYRRIMSLGLVSNKSGVMWSGYKISNKKLRTKLLDELLHEKKIVKLEIGDLDGEYYALTDLDSVKVKKKVTFIAPLDNLIWDRELIENLFNFKYRWEVYTPVLKREYGYYVLPILYGSNFIGRIEFEMQRGSNPLIVKNIWYEQKFSKTMEYENQLRKALNRFAKYLGASQIEGSIYDNTE